MGVCRFRVIFRSIRTRHFRFLRLRSLDGLLVCDDLALGRMVFHIRIKSLTRFCRQSFHCRLRRFFCDPGGSERTLSISCRCDRAVIRRLARCDSIQPIDLSLRLFDFRLIGILDRRQFRIRLIPHSLRAVQLRGRCRRCFYEAAFRIEIPEALCRHLLFKECDLRFICGFRRWVGRIVDGHRAPSRPASSRHRCRRGRHRS